MTKEQAAERILCYLNLERTAKRREKIESFIQQVLDEQLPNTVFKYEVLEKLRVVPREVYYTKDKPRNIAVIMSDIAKEVCERNGITLEQLKANSPDEMYQYDPMGLKRKFKRRSKELVDARQEFALRIVRNYGYISYKAIAAYLGLKDHSCIAHYVHYRVA